MKSLLNSSLIFCATLIFLNLAPNQSDAASCTASTTWNSGTAFDPNEGNFYQTCTATPIAMKLKVFEIGLCKTAPTPADTSTCSTLFKNAAGKEVEINKAGEVPLDQNATMDSGVYGHVYLIISSTFSTKVQMEFSAARKAIDGTAGTVCFTNGNTFDEVTEKYDVISCAGAGAPAFSTETLKVFENTTAGATNAFNAQLNYVAPGTNSRFNLFLLDSNRSLSTRTVLDGNGDLVPMNTVDRPYIFGHQILSNSVSIDPLSTRGLDVGISITDALEVGFVQDGGNYGKDSSGNPLTCNDPNNVGCIADSILSGFQFKITTN